MGTRPEVEAVAKGLAALDCAAEAAWPEYVESAKQLIAVYEKAKAMKQYDRHDL